MRWFWLFLLITTMAIALALVAWESEKSRGVGRALLYVVPVSAFGAFCGWRAEAPVFVVGPLLAFPFFLLALEHFKGCFGVILFLFPVVLLCGVFGGLALWERRNEAIIEQGKSALAKVLEVRDLNTSVGPDPMIELRLQVLPSDGMPYETETKLVVSRLTMAYYRPGITVNVKCDPKKPKRVVVESIQSGALP